jgi:hypothetical protein
MEKKIAINLITQNVAKEAVEAAVDLSISFAVYPLPEEEWEIVVNEDAALLLIDASDALTQARIAMILKTETLI